MSGGKGVLAAQVAYYVGTAFSGLVIVLGALVTGRPWFSLVGLLIVVLSLVGIVRRNQSWF